MRSSKLVFALLSIALVMRFSEALSNLDQAPVASYEPEQVAPAASFGYDSIRERAQVPTAAFYREAQAPTASKNFGMEKWEAAAQAPTASRIFGMENWEAAAQVPVAMERESQAPTSSFGMNRGRMNIEEISQAPTASLKPATVSLANLDRELDTMMGMTREERRNFIAAQAPVASRGINHIPRESITPTASFENMYFDRSQAPAASVGMDHHPDQLAPTASLKMDRRLSEDLLAQVPVSSLHLDQISPVAAYHEQQISPSASFEAQAPTTSYTMGEEKVNGGAATPVSAYHNRRLLQATDGTY
ncbi:hypothetical protein SELMODRAFT_413107 [Selaginella moellendorffii]|uniref:Uncharacterized protein n=1 Tax=Selaginella moellendorffii TaxID=88036 RepID=D8RNC9_SELML|nr:hypothetical protein SELMODRAFT_413107 [Selaginella moellendorffii]